MRKTRTPIAQIEFMRNLLAFLLVGAFIAMLPALIAFAIPDANKDLLTYMLGQLSGMATVALGFYFVNKVGQDALDAQRAENTGKLADVAKSALSSAEPAQAAAAAADHVQEGAQRAADEVKGQ